MVYLPAGYSQFTTHGTLECSFSLWLSVFLTVSYTLRLYLHCLSAQPQSRISQVRCQFVQVHQSVHTMFHITGCFHTTTHIWCLYLSHRKFKSHLIAKNRLFPTVFLLFHSLYPFVTHVGEQEHPMSHVMVKFQQPHSDVPSSCHSIYVTRPFGGGSYGSLAGERFVFTHSRTLGMHIYMHIHRCLTHIYTTKEG